ncbi:hypothetical protein BDQ17DRAFT_891480 [Cyathus striatus]|nr:hypothetical protein BDQ17DRAFT_985733 [Cyathus striatus]KAF8997100.1 hypothetical protein BDQ17DRAFT_891480 [Cyathus striatus]
MVTALLSANRVTYRFGKGMMPKTYSSAWILWLLFWMIMRRSWLRRMDWVWLLPSLGYRESTSRDGGPFSLPPYLLPPPPLYPIVPSSLSL